MAAAAAGAVVIGAPAVQKRQSRGLGQRRLPTPKMKSLVIKIWSQISLANCSGAHVKTNVNCIHCKSALTGCDRNAKCSRRLKKETIRSNSLKLRTVHVFEDVAC